MAYGFDEDKSKVEVYSKDETYSKEIIKTKKFANAGVAAGGTTSATFSAEQLGASSLDEITILEVRQAVSNVESTYRSGWVINGTYVKNNKVYPSCSLLYGYGITVNGYNNDTAVRRVDVEITYMITDTEHAG